MRIEEALRILDVHDEIITHALIKDVYRHLAKKYHPDRNPNGLRIMQDVNVAYDCLSKIPESQLAAKRKLDFFELNGLIKYKNGMKIYVKGNTYPFRQELKTRGFRWNPDKKLWWRYDNV